MGVVYNLTTVACMGDTKKPSPGMDVGKKKRKNRILSYYMNSNLPAIQTFPSKNPIRVSQLNQSLTPIFHPTGNIPADCKKPTQIYICVSCEMKKKKKTVYY